MANKIKKDTGFVAGTLVHTDKGLIPIQDVKVGDMALSSPEQGDGSVREYKRVVNTFNAKEQEIYELVINAFVEPNEEYEFGTRVLEHIFLTKEHPVYVDFASKKRSKRNNTWQPVNELNLDDIVIVHNSKHKEQAETRVVSFSPLIDVKNNYALRFEENEELGYLTLAKFEENTYDALGFGIDDLTGFHDEYIIAGTLRNQDDLEEDVERILEIRDYVYSHVTDEFKTAVYNFEVEDYHTYFVGEQGLWVHDNMPIKK